MVGGRVDKGGLALSEVFAYELYQKREGGLIRGVWPLIAKTVYENKDKLFSASRKNLY